MAKVVLFPKGDVTPENMLAQVLDNNPDLVVVVARHDGEWVASWSSCDIGDLVWALKILEIDVNKIVTGEKDSINYG